jgi:hypothetical protein
MSGEGVKSNSNGINRVRGIRITGSFSTVPLARQDLRAVGLANSRAKH